MGEPGCVASCQQIRSQKDPMGTSTELTVFGTYFKNRFISFSPTAESGRAIQSVASGPQTLGAQNRFAYKQLFSVKLGFLQVAFVAAGEAYPIARFRVNSGNMGSL